MSTPLEEKVLDLVAEITRHEKDRITLASRFVEDLEANSLDVVELACLVEGEFDVRVSDARIASIRTVGDVIQAIHELKQG